MLKILKWIYNKGQKHRLVMTATLIDDYANKRNLTPKEMEIVIDIKDKIKAQYRHIGE